MKEDACDLCGVRLAARSLCTRCVDWLIDEIDKEAGPPDPLYALKYFAGSCIAVGVLVLCLGWLAATY